MHVCSMSVPHSQCWLHSAWLHVCSSPKGLMQNLPRDAAHHKVLLVKCYCLIATKSLKRPEAHTCQGCQVNKEDQEDLPGMSLGGLSAIVVGRGPKRYAQPEAVWSKTSWLLSQIPQQLPCTEDKIQGTSEFLSSPSGGLQGVPRSVHLVASRSFIYQNQWGLPCVHPFPSSLFLNRSFRLIWWEVLLARRTRTGQLGHRLSDWIGKNSCLAL